MDTETKMVIAGAAVVGAALLLVGKKVSDAMPSLSDLPSAAGDAAATVAAGAVSAANGAVVGTVTGVSEAVGLPTPAETITDSAACKVYMDANGWWAASAKCSAPALIGAMQL